MMKQVAYYVQNVGLVKILKTLTQYVMNYLRADVMIIERASLIFVVPLVLLVMNLLGNPYSSDLYVQSCVDEEHLKQLDPLVIFDINDYATSKSVVIGINCDLVKNVTFTLNAIKSNYGEEYYLANKSHYLIFIDSFSSSDIINYLSGLSYEEIISPAVKKAVSMSIPFGRSGYDHSVNWTQVELDLFDYLLNFYKENKEKENSLAILELAHHLNVRSIYRTYSCLSFCNLDDYVNYFPSDFKKQNGSELGLDKAIEKIAGIECVDCDDYNQKYMSNKAMISLYLDAYEGPFYTQESFLARRGDLERKLNMANAVVPLEFQHQLYMLTLLNLGEGPIHQIVSKLSHLPEEIITNEKLETWFLGFPTSNFEWSFQRQSAIELFCLERFEKNKNGEYASFYLEMAIKLARIQGIIADKTDGVDGCDQYERVAIYLSEYEKQYGVFPDKNFLTAYNQEKIKCEDD